jgi:hypothetical protein
MIYGRLANDHKGVSVMEPDGSDLATPPPKDDSTSADEAKDEQEKQLAEGTENSS